MKIALSELKPNPFKVGINSGKLNEESIAKIRSNIKELGLMGSLPVVKRGESYHLVAGHHRVEALKREFGKNFQIEVVVHNYNDDQLLRGMVIENLTQRSDEILEVTDNLNLIRKHLKDDCSTVEQSSKKKDKLGRENRQIEIGSIRHIASWLNQNDYEVMSVGRISTYLHIGDNLDKSLLKTVKVNEGGVVEEGQLGVVEASNLARVDKKYQKDLKEVLDDTGLDCHKKGNLVAVFNTLDDEDKQKVVDKELSLFEVNNKKKEEEGMGAGQMAIKFQIKALDLITEMRSLRRTLYQFRNEKLFDAFNPSQRKDFKIKLTKVRDEYGELVSELEKSLEVI